MLAVHRKDGSTRPVFVSSLIENLLARQSDHPNGVIRHAERDRLRIRRPVDSEESVATQLETLFKFQGLSIPNLQLASNTLFTRRHRQPFSIRRVSQ